MKIMNNFRTLSIKKRFILINKSSQQMWVVIMRPIRQKEKDFALIGYWNFELFKKFF